MSTEADNDRIFAELQELVAMEVKDILATAIQEGFAPRDVISALELALRAEIEALATNTEVTPTLSKANPDPLPLAHLVAKGVSNADQENAPLLSTGRIKSRAH